MLDARAQLEREKTLHERMADAITRFTGSIPFVYLHAALFGGWLLVRAGIETADEVELLKRDVSPEGLLEHIDGASRQTTSRTA
jgi:hypothetical protein